MFSALVAVATALSMSAGHGVDSDAQSKFHARAAKVHCMRGQSLLVHKTHHVACLSVPCPLLPQADDKAASVGA